MPDPAGAEAIVLAPHERTLPRLLARQAERFGDRPMLSMGATAATHWRHADAMHAVACRGAALHQAGVARGERVALMCGNRIEALEVFLGCGWIGAVSVPINGAAMCPQIAYYLANSGARMLVIEDAFVERLAGAGLAQTPLQAIWIVGDASRCPAAIDGVPCVPYPAARTALAPADVQPGDPLAILYTSGTTGPAKGVICPHAQYCGWGVNTAAVLGLGSDDVLATTLPLFHINALNTYAQAAVTGCRVVFEPRFSASGFWAAMRACDASVIYLLGAMVPILLAQSEAASERAHRVRIGLGPGVPAAASAAFLARTGVRLVEGYGSTESNFVIASTAPGAPAVPRSGVMGWPMPGFEARVVDAQDVELANGEAGELVLRANEPFAFASGYFGMPDQTVEAWRNLWLHTGDRVVRDADGAFRFIDRIKDAIRRRGENISSFEVEQVLAGHPAVASVAVFPVSSELAEDEVMAALVARVGAVIDPAEVARYCETRLPYFSVPRYIDIVADLPRTENGKVQKFRLREQGVGPGTWDRGARAR